MNAARLFDDAHQSVEQIQEKEHLNAARVSERDDDLIHSRFNTAGDAPVEDIPSQQQASEQRGDDAFGPYRRARS